MRHLCWSCPPPPPCLSVCQSNVDHLLAAFYGCGCGCDHDKSGGVESRRGGEALMMCARLLACCGWVSGWIGGHMCVNNGSGGGAQ